MQLQLGYNSSRQPEIWRSIDNNNILITGRSGQGKSVMLSLIASQLVAQGFHVVFLDSADEYGRNGKGKPTIWPPDDARSLDILDPRVPIKAFFPNVQSDGSLEKAPFAASRIVNTFKLTMGLGDVQASYLARTVQDSFDDRQCCSIGSLIDTIEEDAEEGNPVAKRLVYRFDIFTAFPEVVPDWASFLEKPGATVINTTAIMECTAQEVILEVLLSNLWFHKKSHAQACPLAIILDEAHNVSFKKGLSVQKIIREGRKFGISGCFSTQWLDEERMGALRDAGLKLFFLPGDNALEYALDALTPRKNSDRAQVQEDLRGLCPGEFLYRPNGGRAIWVNARTDIQG